MVQYLSMVRRITKNTSYGLRVFELRIIIVTKNSVFVT